ELVSGKALALSLDRGKLPVEVAISLARQVAAALTHAHARGVVHRDVSPSNIIMAGETAKLADFGYARPVVRSGEILTATGEAVGTPLYAAPEAFDDGKEAGAPADVYGLGAVLYHCLAGRAPLEDVDVKEWSRGHPKRVPAELRGVPAA